MSVVHRRFRPLSSVVIGVVAAIVAGRMAEMPTAATAEEVGSALPVESAESAARQQAYREAALNQRGDAARGRELFNDVRRAACSKCHTVDASHRGVGPDLNAIGDKFSRVDLITAILEPSKAIAVGYSTSVVTTDAGLVYQGVLHRVTDQWLELLDAENKPVRVELSSIEEQNTLSTSLMPAGQERLLTVEEFTDLVEFLTTLRQAPTAGSLAGVTESTPRAATPVTFRPFFDSNVRFHHPVWFGQVPDREQIFLVLEQGGRAFVVEGVGDRATQREIFDYSRDVRNQGATGLLGCALHPQFTTNGRIFLKYQVVRSGRIVTIVEERRLDPRSLTLDDTQPAKTLLTIPGSTPDHNGGCLLFGPDGFLYIGAGDSGPQRDPEGHGQDLSTLLGKILRIDVDHPTGDLPYGIPPDNPFCERPTARGEVWAYGFREPWRFSFDRQTHDLWVGDVGQDRFEEVGIVKAGENHGWNVFEGSVSFSDQYRQADMAYVPPLLTYPRRLGVSVTGGHVYRGSQTTPLQGHYIFADFESRRMWALRQRDRQREHVVEIGQAPSRAVSFAEDRDGELYLIGYDNGVIYRLEMESVDLTPLQFNVVVATSEDAPVQWRFTTERPHDGWMHVDFDDATWKLGPGGFGTQGTPGARVRTDWNTAAIWLRRTFELPENFDAQLPLRLSIHHDEDVHVYLNGVEAASLPRWTSGYVEVVIDAAAQQTLHAGRNIMAIECRQNNGGQYIDAGIIQWVTPAPKHASD